MLVILSDPERSEGEPKDLHLLFVVLKGHGFTACGKIHLELREVSGHNFSRAVNGRKMKQGFSP
jgi:uncharacterized protein YunC (DUF1805 family)